jgi:hypothetical protein
MTNYLEKILEFAFWMLVIIVSSFIVFAEWHGLKAEHLLHYDYGFFYYAFEVILHHQSASALYNSHAQQVFLARLHFPFLPHNQYVYPPQFALFWCPFGLLPFSLSCLIWMVMSIILYILGIVWVAKVLWPRLGWRSIGILVICASIMTPFQLDVGVRNVNCVLFSAVARSFYLLYCKRQAWWAGIPLGLAVTFKVTPAAILVYLLLRKQWRASLSALSTIGIVSGITALWLGRGCLILYAKKFMEFGRTSMKNGPAPYNESLVGVLGMFDQHHWLHLSSSWQSVCFLIFVALTAIVVLFITLRTPSDRCIDIGLASLAPLLFSPLVEQMHMVFVLPALMSLIYIAQQTRQNNTLVFYPTFRLLMVVTIVSFFVLSLPTTFALNYLVRHWPQLFWVHTHMFWVLLTLFVTIVWQSLRLKMYRIPRCRFEGGGLLRLGRYNGF